MHVSLIITPFFYFERIHPPLALGYLASITKLRGHTCDTLDLRMRLERDVDLSTRDRLRSYGMVYFEPSLPKDVLEILNPHIDVWADEIARANPRVVGVSCFRPTRVASLALAAAIKKRLPQTFMVFGGPDCTLNFNEILKHSAVDAVVIGDGEEAWAGILDAIESELALDSVPNLIYRTRTVLSAGEPPVSTPSCAPGTRRSAIKRRAPSASLVVPDFTGLPIPEYFASRPDKPPILPLLWQRGCVADCSFCNARAFFPTVEARTPESVVEEMSSHFEKYGVRVFEFYDLSLNNYPRELRRLCELLLALPTRFQWFGMMRFTRGLREDFIKYMAAAGCIRASFGMESGSPRVLRHMRKNTDMSLVADILRTCHQNGIDTHCTLIVGYPTETEEDFQMTVDFLDKHQQYLSSVNCGTTCSIKPEQPLWKMKDEMGIKFDDKGDWYLGDNTIEVRIDRLTRLNAAVSKMSFQRSRRFDAWTDNIANRLGLRSPNLDEDGNREEAIQEWPVRRVSIRSSSPKLDDKCELGDACG